MTKKIIKKLPFLFILLIMKICLFSGKVMAATCYDSSSYRVAYDGDTASPANCFDTYYHCDTSLDSSATGSCSFSSSSYCVCNGDTGSWEKVGSGCTATFSCKSGYVSASNRKSGYAYSVAGTSSCQSCGNNALTCYVEIGPTCATAGGTCYSNTCLSMNGTTSAYIYSSVSGYCSSGYCCDSTAKTTCAETGGSCYGVTCSALNSGSGDPSKTYSSESGWCSYTTPYCCSSATKPKCSCGDTTAYSCGTTYTVSGENCQTATCTGTGAIAGGWTDYSYSSWGTCSSCVRTRTGTRTCTNPAPACGGASCSGSATTIESDTNCAVNATYGSWGSCNVTCGWGTQYRSELTPAVCGGTTQSTSQSCYMGCCPSNGTAGVCGSANGQLFTSVPSANLCSTGTASVITTESDFYSWICYGTAGSCGGYAGADISCSAIRNQAPLYSGLEIRNAANVMVAADENNRNQICQSEFNRQPAKFVVSATDLDGVGDIVSIQLKIGTIIYSPTSLSNGVAIFDISYSSGNNSVSALPIEVNVSDSYQSTGWVSTGRYFKFWNCEVPVSGSLFDGSEATFEVINCASGSQDFINKVSGTTIYGLAFTGVAFDSDKVMTVNSPDYNGGSNKLMWGAQYRASFTNLDGEVPIMKYPGNNTCNSTNGSFTVDNSAQIGVDPYAVSQGLILDFSSVLDQFPWYQVAGGGIFAKYSIVDSIPPTCTGACKSYVSVVSELGDSNGLIAAQTIAKGSGLFGEENNWGVNKDVANRNYNYKYFYNEYFSKLNQGVMYGVGKSMSEIGSTLSGVVFVDGDLTIDSNNIVPSGSFLMLIVKGKIVIKSNVTNVQAILIADGDVLVEGSSDNQLKIYGSIYTATGSVRFVRGFATKSLNNKNPSVVVISRPDFIFSMPGKLTKILSDWNEGI